VLLRSILLAPLGRGLSAAILRAQRMRKSHGGKGEGVFPRHSGASRNPAREAQSEDWTPAFAGVTPSTRLLAGQSPRGMRGWRAEKRKPMACALRHAGASRRARSGDLTTPGRAFAVSAPHPVRTRR
jgi:hypothetical protein